MAHPAGATGAGTDALKSSNETVIGKIDGPPDDIHRVVAEWLRYLKGRGKKSTESYRRDIGRAIRLAGWTRPSDVTWSAVTGYLAERRDDGWKGTTYNRNLSTLRSFTAFLRRAGYLIEDPLQDAERAESDGSDGSRAATLQEARAIIREAWLRQQTDHRCSGNRALYWTCLFGHACRLGEPAKWRRRHLVLDHAVPHVAWSVEISKSSRPQRVALSNELAGLLREHMARCDRDRRAAGIELTPEDPVFPVVPSPGSFRADRKKTRIHELDDRGRRFSPHSARKMFSTLLTAAGIAEKMVDYLMRHSGRVEHRYYDPPLEEQAAAANRMPRLWPEEPTPDGGQVVHKPDFSGDDLTNSPARSDDVAGARCSTNSKTPRPAGPLANGHLCATSISTSEVLQAAESLGAGLVGRHLGVPGLSPRDFQSGNAHCQIENRPRLNTDLADLLDSLARLLRNGAADGRDRTSGNGAGGTPAA